MKTVVLMTLLMFSLQGQAYTLEDCGKEIISVPVLLEIDGAFKSAINRKTTPFSYGYSINEYSKPIICTASAYSEDDWDITVGSLVSVNAWNEDGDTLTKSSECFVTLEYRAKVWKSSYIRCEDLAIEQRL